MCLCAPFHEIEFLFYFFCFRKWPFSIEEKKAIRLNHFKLQMGYILRIPLVAYLLCARERFFFSNRPSGNLVWNVRAAWFQRMSFRKEKKNNKFIETSKHMMDSSLTRIHSHRSSRHNSVNRLMYCKINRHFYRNFFSFVFFFFGVCAVHGNNRSDSHINWNGKSIAWTRYGWLLLKMRT